MSCRGANRRGVAAVELAMLGPFLAVLVLGMFELSRGIMIKQLLNDAARKACRTAIQPQTANSSVTKEVNDILTDNGISTAYATTTIQVNGTTADCSTARQNDKIMVKISIPTSATFWISTFFLSRNSIESDSVIMMRQN